MTAGARRPRGSTGTSHARRYARLTGALRVARGSLLLTTGRARVALDTETQH